MADNKPEVAVIMGSASDWETMKHACEMLDQFEVPYMKQVISAHRTPELMGEFAHNARANGLDVPELEQTFYGMLEFRIEDPDGNRLWIGKDVSPED